MTVLSLCIPASSFSICTPAPCYSEWSLQTSSVNMTQELVQDADSGLAPDLLRRTCRVMRSQGDSHQGCTALLDVITLKQGLTDFWIMNNSTVRNRYYSVCIDVAETGFYKTLLTLPTWCLLFCSFAFWPYSSPPPFLPVIAFLRCSLCTVNITHSLWTVLIYMVVQLSPQ